MHLRGALARSVGVDRAPNVDVANGALVGAVGDEGLAAIVDLQRQERDVEIAELLAGSRRRGGADQARREHSNDDEETDAHRLDSRVAPGTRVPL